MRFSDTAPFALALGLCVSAVPSAFGWTLNFDPPGRVAGSTLTFKVNYTDCPATLDPILDQAFAIWNGVPSSFLKIEKNGTTSTTGAQITGGTNSDFAIVCDTTYKNDTGADPSVTLAVTIVSADSEGHIGQGGIVLNAETSVFANDTIEQQVQTMAHEIGHVFGLGHSSDPRAIMYFVQRPHGSIPTISQDDVDAITFLYPRNEIGRGDQGQLFGCGGLSSAAKRPPRPPFDGAAEGLLCVFGFLSLIWLLCQSLKFLPSKTT